MASATSEETPKTSFSRGSGAETVPELDETGADGRSTFGILIDSFEAGKAAEILLVPRDPDRTASDRPYLHLDEVLGSRDADEPAAGERPARLPLDPDVGARPWQIEKPDHVHASRSWHAGASNAAPW
jgi:hypothetical protein